MPPSARANPSRLPSRRPVKSLMSPLPSQKDVRRQTILTTLTAVTQQSKILLTGFSVSAFCRHNFVKSNCQSYNIKIISIILLNRLITAFATSEMSQSQQLSRQYSPAISRSRQFHPKSTAPIQTPAGAQIYNLSGCKCLTARFFDQRPHPLYGQ